MIDAERQIFNQGLGRREYALLDARAARRAEAWHEWEADRLGAVVERGDDVFEVGGAVSALTGALAARAGWVFVAATDAAELDALRTALDPVRPHNVTLGPLSRIRDWCRQAEVVFAADWSPRSDDPDAELASLAEIAERALVVTGWRSALGEYDDTASGVELALAFARRCGLEARLVSTPVDDDRLRSVVTITTTAGHR